MRSRAARATLALTTLVGLLGSSSAAANSVNSARAWTAGAITVLSTKRDSARVVSYTVSTPSLQMSSTTPLTVHVVLPTGYDQNRARRYPVLYALPGTSNKASFWLDSIRTVEHTRALPVIVVIPDGTYDGDGGGFYTNWVDQTTTRGVANWETFHTRELVQWVDARYRTVRARTGRAIVGFSQGGFGSMSYAARNPGLYGAAAALSGAVDIYQGVECRVGAAALVSGIMTGLNQVQPFAPFGNPVTDAANWQAHDPGSLVKNLSRTRIDLYSGQGVPAQSDLSDPATPNAAAWEALVYRSNLCFQAAADAAGVRYHWQSTLVGTHAHIYADRAMKDYLPRLMGYFRTGR